jgi:hypothetical protein
MAQHAESYLRAVHPGNSENVGWVITPFLEWYAGAPTNSEALIETLQPSEDCWLPRDFSSMSNLITNTV